MVWILKLMLLGWLLLLFLSLLVSMVIIDTEASDYDRRPSKKARLWILYSTFVPIFFAAYSARDITNSATWTQLLANLGLCVLCFVFAGLLRLVAVMGLTDAGWVGPLSLFRLLFQRFILRYNA